MNERSIGTIKPEKWNNIPLCIVDGFRIIINDNLRLEESSKENSQSLEDMKQKNEVRFKKIQAETKKSTEDTLNQINKISKNTDTYLLQVKEQIKRDKDQMMNTVDDKTGEVKTRLNQIEDMVTRNEESKRVLSIVKTMFKDLDTRLDNKFSNFENSFSELLIKNIQCRKVVGQSCHFANQVEFIFWCYETIDNLLRTTHEHSNKISELDSLFREMEVQSEQNKQQIEERFVGFETEIQKFQPQIDMVHTLIEEQERTQQEKIEPILEELKRFEDLQAQINANQQENKNNLNKISREIDEQIKKDILGLEARLNKMEDNNTKTQQNNLEKFMKLESDFKFSLGNIENRNMEIINQARDLKESIDLRSIRKSEENEKEAVSKSVEHQERMASIRMGPLPAESAIVPEAAVEEIKNEVKAMIEKMMKDHKSEQDDGLQTLLKDFMTIKRNTVDEVLKSVEKKDYPVTEEVERAVTRIISQRMERSLSAPCRMTVKTQANLQENDHHSVVSLKSGGNVTNQDALFDANETKVDTFTRAAIKATKIPNKTVSSVSKTMASTSLKWNQKAQIQTQQVSMDYQDYTDQIKVAGDLIDHREDIARNSYNQEYNNYQNRDEWYTHQINKASRQNRPEVTNLASIKVNLTQDASIQENAEMTQFVTDAGASYSLQNNRKQERLNQLEKTFEGKFFRDIMSNQTKKEKMQRQLVQLVNEPQNLRNIMKLDEFKLSVWDVHQNDPSKYSPYDNFKKKAEINFDVNQFYKPDHRDEIETPTEGPKKMFDYGGKNYKHTVIK